MVPKPKPIRSEEVPQGDEPDKVADRRQDELDVCRERQEGPAERDEAAGFDQKVR